MIHVSILGATGYVGLELTRLLYSHPSVHIAHLVSHSQAGQTMGSVYPGLSGRELPVLEELDVESLAKDTDVFFTCLPHGASKEVIPQLFSTGKYIVDMSGDYRYNDASVYEAWYGVRHSSPELLAQSVYGLPELHRESIRKARLIGNPGCYTTCSILGLAPLLKQGCISPHNIIIDAKSGATGAGRGVSQALHFCETNESMKAYKVATHRHTSEIEQELSLLAGQEILLSFTPHLLPVNRGILATCYANLVKKASAGELISLYRDFYAEEPFVSVLPAGQLPELKHVVGSNSCAIGLVVDERLNRVVVVSCIDNLVKGAAGQAVQNMNLLFGLPETEGLSALPWSL